MMYEKSNCEVCDLSLPVRLVKTPIWEKFLCEECDENRPAWEDAAWYVKGEDEYTLLEETKNQSKNCQSKTKQPTLDILIVQPKTPEEVDAILDDIRDMVGLIPESEEWGEDYFQNIKDYPHYLTLVYHNGHPVAHIQISDSEGYSELGKDSLEFSGSVLPEYREHGLTLAIAPMVIRKAFKRTGKRKMLAKIDPDNKEAQAAIVALGFERVPPHPDLPTPDKIIYKLIRKDALNKEIDS